MEKSLQAVLVIAFLCVPVAAAGDDQVNFSGKWALENVEQSRSTPMKTLGPGYQPQIGGGMDGKSPGNDSDVRTGGDGSYRGGEGRLPSIPKKFSAPDLVMTVAQTPTEIKLERTWTQDGQPLISHESYTLDGKDNIIRDAAGKIETKSKAKWRKDGLMIDSVHLVQAGGRTAEIRVRQEFSLSKEGRVLIIKTTQETQSGEVAIRQTFKKP